MKRLSDNVRKVLFTAGAAAAILAIANPINAADSDVPAVVKEQTADAVGSSVTPSEVKPVLVLKSDAVTVNNGDKFNPSSMITYVNDKSGVLPAISITGDVDTNTDGTYTVDYRAVGLDGQSTEQALTVTVKTPQEVLDARAAEEAQRQAEEQAAAEEAQRQAEQQAAQEQAAAEARAAAAQTAALGTGSGSATAQSIIATARSLLGSPYAWGGTSPAGFDCSGFTQYVFGVNGIGLNRTAAAQAGNGYLVSADEAQAGDLALWTGHAAIYEGNGYIIAALNPGLGVQETPFSTGMGSGTFMGFYRVNGVN